MLTRHPVPGMVWLTMQYLEGLRRLGYDSYYVEPHAGDGRTDSAESAAWLGRHAAIFTWGECYGTPTCRVPPTDEFAFLPTRQPVIVDHWQPRRASTSKYFTTVGNWRQRHRDYDFLGERFTWSKDQEFNKLLELPSRSGPHFELALASYDEHDRRLLESNGWRVRPAAELATVDSYR